MIHINKRLLILCISSIIQAASSFDEIFNAGNQLFLKSEFEQALELYKQARTLNDSQAPIHYNIGVTYFELKNYVAAEESLKKALIKNPQHIKAALYLGKIAEAQKKPDTAIQYYTRALSYDPGFLDAVNPLVDILKEKLRCEEALIYLRAAYEHHPHNTILAFNLANTLNMADYTQEALDIYLMLSEKHPNDSSIAYNIAYTYKKLGLLAEALPYYEKTLSLKPNHTEALFSRGLAHLVLGDWEKGWEGYEYRWKRGDHQTLRPYKEPMWRGEPLEHKHIFVYAEQGLGDTFQFIRYLRILKEMGAYITFAPQKALVDIAKLCPYIDTVIPHQDHPESFDYFIPLVSLPYILNTRVETTPHEIPYLYADPTLETYWHTELQKDPNFKIGICWQGNSEYSTAFLRAVVANKSMPVHLFEPLTYIPGVTVYSLQRVTGTNQLIPDSMHLITFGEDFDTQHGRFMDTAAVIKNLDLVITIDTSICHLAAGLGTPVWNLLPNPADWRWMLDRLDTPWYPNMRLFRQPTPGDWVSVINDVVVAVNKLITESGDTVNTYTLLKRHYNTERSHLTSQQTMITNAVVHKTLAKEIALLDEKIALLETWELA